MQGNKCKSMCRHMYFVPGYLIYTLYILINAALPPSCAKCEGSNAKLRVLHGATRCHLCNSPLFAWG